MEWQEIVCAENPFDFFARKNGAVVPVANKPDFRARAQRDCVEARRRVEARPLHCPIAVQSPSILWACEGRVAYWPSAVWSILATAAEG